MGRKAIYVSYIALSASIVAIGPSSFVKVDSFTKPEKLLIIIIGLFALGIFSAILNTLSTIQSLERVQWWVLTEYKGEKDIQPLISKVFGWVMIMVGAGTGLGQIIGLWLFSSFDFRV